MKERVQFHIDSFVDKNGNKRHFVLCGLSQEIIDYFHFIEISSTEPLGTALEAFKTNVCKGLKIGYSICNPNDNFDEELGMTIAEGRARKNKEYALFATKPGYINTDTVSALLKREAEFFKKNPEMYIKGYERMVKA